MYEQLWENHIGPAFERERMRDISAFEIDRLLSRKYKGGYASQTLLHLRSVLSKMFKAAVKWRWLVDNPVRDIEVLSPKRVNREQRALSVEEARLLFEHLKNPVRRIVMIGVTLGLRIGEILGLRADGVDSDALRVRRSWGRGHEGSTKNGKEREIPLHPVLWMGAAIILLATPNVAYRSVGCNAKFLKRLVDLDGFEPSTS